MKLKHFSALSGVLAMGLAGAYLLRSANRLSRTKTTRRQPPRKRDTVAKPMTAKQKKKQEEKLRKELETPYRKWLNEDVAYIITDEERKAFKRLSTDDERENFIEQFWLRRDPTPDTEENEFKEEHYRRIAYANERFASGIPGWKTDRGRIYIVYGPPDEIDDHSSGGTYDRPIEEGGGTTSTFPFIDWTYRYIEGVGSNVKIEFVDPTMSGEFRMTHGPVGKGRSDICSWRGPDAVRADGLGGQIATLHPHRRYNARNGQPAAAGQHGRVRAAVAVRESAKGPAGEVQGSASGGQLQHPLQQSAVQSARGLHPDHRFHGSDDSDHRVPAPRPAVPAEGQHLESHGQHFWAHHLDYRTGGEYV